MSCRTHLWILAVICWVVLLSGIAQAEADNSRVQIGSSITVTEGEQVGDLVCIFCSIRMQGNAKGDVVAVFGSAMIDGPVAGDVVVIGGAARLSDAAHVGGDLVAMGGGLQRDPRSTVKGDITAQSGILIFFLLLLLPLLPVIAIIALVWWLLSRSRRPATPVRV